MNANRTTPSGHYTLDYTLDYMLDALEKRALFSAAPALEPAHASLVSQLATAPDPRVRRRRR